MEQVVRTECRQHVEGGKLHRIELPSVIFLLGFFGQIVEELHERLDRDRRLGLAVTIGADRTDLLLRLDVIILEQHRQLRRRPPACAGVGKMSRPGRDPWATPESASEKLGDAGLCRSAQGRGPVPSAR